MITDAMRTELAERIAWHQATVDEMERRVDQHEESAINCQKLRDEAMDLVIAYEDCLNFLRTT